MPLFYIQRLNKEFQINLVCLHIINTKHIEIKLILWL